MKKGKRKQTITIIITTTKKHRRPTIYGFAKLVYAMRRNLIVVASVVLCGLVG